MGFRSAEAIKRRATKRGNTVDEQRKFDSTNEHKRLKKEHDERREQERVHAEAKKDKLPRTEKGKKLFVANVEEAKSVVEKVRKKAEKPHSDPPSNNLDEWICPKCSNKNWLRRTTCNSKTCFESRPSTLSVPSTLKPPKPSSSYSKPHGRHNPDTSKNLKWAPQSSQEKIDENQDLLRKLEAGGEMTDEERKRAQVLKDRRERKAAKKKQKK
ncbi:hypothetical protein TL16_g03665 [Triparma laevis f. inornata]|uniref:RanBP2-type domain-containing protein n=1 Tax=Triparma laevis f. inornata TaxID=1714386 RepID=A0A9W7A0C3_9STRA|nr:hypothetical protein TL16_g03665 [Triparma laevis f. inornata]